MYEAITRKKEFKITAGVALFGLGVFAGAKIGRQLLKAEVKKDLLSILYLTMKEGQTGFRLTSTTGDQVNFVIQTVDNIDEFTNKFLSVHF